MTDAGGFVLNYAYDAYGNVSRLTYPDGHGVDFGYSPAGELLSITDGDKLFSYSYTTGGRLSTLRLPSGVEARLNYGEQGLLQRIEYYDAAAALMGSQDYQINAAGLVENASGWRSTQYSYDARRRLTRMEESDGWFEAYSYDAAGNRIAVEMPDGVTRYEYDAAGQVIRISAGDVITDISYDAGGKAVSERQGEQVITHRYDYEGRLIETQDGDTITQLVYNGDGVAVARIVNGERSDLVHDAASNALLAVRQPDRLG